MSIIDTRRRPKLDYHVNGTQCTYDRLLECPSDTCNRGMCHNGCVGMGCTEMRCDYQNKNENQLCELSLNNCVDGLRCVDQNDGCDNGIGRCVKTGKHHKHDS